MPRSTIKVLFLLLSMAMLGPVSAEPTQKEIEKKLSKVQEQIRKSQQKLESQRGELGSLEKHLRESEKIIGNLNNQLNATEDKLERSHKKISELIIKERQLEKKLLKHHDILYAQIRSEYQYGGQKKLKLLLNQQEPEKLGRNLIYYDYLHRARLIEIEKAKKILQSINEVQAEIKEEQELIEQAKLSLLSEKQLLIEAQNQRKTTISSLHNNLSSEKDKLANLERNEKHLKDLIENLRAVLPDLPVLDKEKSFSKSQGKLYWPVVGKPSNQFGQNRNSARRKLNWQGVFIPSNEGNNVRSIYHGRVAFAEWMRGLGLLIIIDHGDGYMSLYGHNQSLFKQVGEWVDAGEKVAAVGNSGGNNKPGLYFEIRKQGNPINPAKWCAKAAVSRRPASS